MGSYLDAFYYYIFDSPPYQAPSLFSNPPLQQGPPLQRGINQDSPSHPQIFIIYNSGAPPFQQRLKMLSTMIALPLAVMATLAGTATATPITAGGSNLGPARAALSSGRFTYYAPGLGACGVTNTEAELVVALSYVDFDPYTPAGNPNNNSLCGKKLRASYNGKSVDVTVADRCPSCASGSLDLSPAAFRKWFRKCRLPCSCVEIALTFLV